MSKTVKEVAEILGVSKTAIRKYLTPEFRDQYTELDSSGKIIISQNGFKILLDAMGKTANQPQTTENQFSETTANQPQTTENQFSETTANHPQTTANHPQTTANQSQTTANQSQTTANLELMDNIIQNRLYEILEKELQAKNEQIAALQAELSAERRHSREQAERIAVLADQAQRLQAGSMRIKDGNSQDQTPPRKKHWWKR